MVIVSVAVPGPPPVSTWIVPKKRNTSISRTVKMIAGISAGMTMWRSTLQSLAPSMRAASIS